jgi:hypothetical protein
MDALLHDLKKIRVLNLLIPPSITDWDAPLPALEVGLLVWHCFGARE